MSPSPFSHFSLFTKCQFRYFYTALFDHRYRSRGKFSCFSAFIKYRKTEITVIILPNNIKEQSTPYTGIEKSREKQPFIISKDDENLLRKNTRNLLKTGKNKQKEASVNATNRVRQRFQYRQPSLQVLLPLDKGRIFLRKRLHKPIL